MKIVNIIISFSLGGLFIAFGCATIYGLIIGQLEKEALTYCFVIVCALSAKVCFTLYRTLIKEIKNNSENGGV